MAGKVWGAEGGRREGKRCGVRERKERHVWEAEAEAAAELHCLGGKGQRGGRWKG